MKLSTSKKILLLGLILLIIAGIVVIALKGLNVDLLFRQHEAVNLNLIKKVDYKRLEDICKEIFVDKHVSIRKVELFGDSVNISVDSITDEEKELLIEKINEEYELTGDNKYDTDNLKVLTIPNIRLRDIAMPYVKPIIISAFIIFAYMMILYRKMNIVNIVLKLVGILLITELSILSLVAITRLPITALVINLMFFVAIIEILIYNHKLYKTRN